MTQFELDAVFREVVREEFKWVESRLGLSLELTDAPDRLSFGHDRCRLTVGRTVRVSDPSRKVDAAIADLSGENNEEVPAVLAGRSFRAGQVAQLLHPEKSESELRARYSGKNYWADTEDQIRSATKQVSLDWAELLTRELIQSEEFWDGLVSVAITNLMNLTGDPARAEAIAAFEDRDFARAIALYERVPGALSGADKKRLEISRRHVSG